MLSNIHIEYFKGFRTTPVELTNCGPINAIIGKNNSGKSTILHAIDMAGLALSVRGWDAFQPKLEVKDMFSDAGPFRVILAYKDNTVIEIKANSSHGPTCSPEPTEGQRLKTVFVHPDPGTSLLRRRHHTPNNVIQLLEARNYTEINALDILYAISYFGGRQQRGLGPSSYTNIVDQIRQYFPDIDDVESDRTPDDISTLTYTEYGRKLDVLYSGTGLKHFLDVLLKTTVSGAQILLLDEPESGLHPDLQRQFLEFLYRLSSDKGIQVFMATHSPVLLNYADSITLHRVRNVRGERSATHVPKDALHTALSDLGIRPSDLFNTDVCILVEGADDVIFFERVLDLYRAEFSKVSVGVQQYAGGAAEGICNGSIDVRNITQAQKYAFWVRDRDSRPDGIPATNATKFKNKLEQAAFQCHILHRREIEYYYPEGVLRAAQNGDTEKERKVLAILRGDQDKKFKEAARESDLCVPHGKRLRQLLQEHLTSFDELPEEIQTLMKQPLGAWVKELRGD
ncbi:MAG: AAA family ATPase [Planctomycetota bacterium]